MLIRLFAFLCGLTMLQGCVVGTAIGVTGDVLEGTAKTGVFAVKTTGKVAGAVLPGGKKDDE